MSVINLRTENYWQQAFDAGEVCEECEFCIKINNYHPYGDAYCRESVRDCAVPTINECPAVQLRLAIERCE